MRRFLLCLLLLFAGLLHADETAPRPLNLIATDGQSYEPLAPGETKPVLLFFISLDCPVTADFVSEINQITADYSSKLAIHIVNSQARSIDLSEGRQKAALLDFTAPVLLDSRVRLARRLQSSIRPEAVVVIPGGRTLYQGRITDLYLDPLKRQPAATTRDLRDALDAILSGGAAPEPQHAAQGCKVIGVMRGESYPFSIQVLSLITGALFFGAPLVSFLRGFRKKKPFATMMLGWGMLVLGSLSVDLFIPMLAVHCYDQAAPAELMPETPCSAGMIIVGWLLPLIFHAIGDMAHGMIVLIRHWYAKRLSH